MVQLSKDKNSSAASGASCCSGLEGLLSPRLFKALSDPKRVSLLVRLAEEGCPCTVSQVAEGSDIDLSVVSRHLAILREAGILKCVKRGKKVWCSVQTDTLARILRELAGALEVCCPPGHHLEETTRSATRKGSSAGKTRRKKS